MSNFVQVIKDCEAANGAGTKKLIQAALAKADITAQNLISAALNPYAVYGVRKFDMPKSGPVKTTSHAYEEFFCVLERLVSRDLTGDAARNAVTGVLGGFTIEEQDYIVRVLDKDLKAGFSADTFNKVWPKNTIPSFDVMLADKCEDTEDFEKYVTFPCQGDWKFDGQRNIAIQMDGKPADNRARSGKASEHLNGLFDEDLAKIRAYLGYDFILDGEAFASDFTETINAKKEGNDAAKANMRIRAFFLMPLTDWIAQKTTITMRQNRKALGEILKACKCKKITLSEGREVTSYQDMMEYCNEVIDVHKQEGLILKDWDAVYTWDRTYAWTKVKRFYDVDARFVSFYPGRPKSRLADTVGGANCVAFLENGERLEFNVGSGFSDKDREDMKKNPAKWLATTHVIKYQEVSRSKSKAVASLRFCTYEHSRDDKLVEI
jgi:DNA ligase-1